MYAEVRAQLPVQWTSGRASGRQSNHSEIPKVTTAFSRRLLLPLVFISGMASLGIEFGASRLLAPYFGTSLYVWGVLIGLVLVYLSAGYVIGGRLADRHPREEVLYQITAWAGLWIGIIPLVSYPILLASQQGFKELSVGLVAGTLFAVLAFAAPVILLGCISPFAIRLLLRDVETEHRGTRLCALDRGKHPRHVPSGLLVHPDIRDATDARGFGLVLVAVSVTQPVAVAAAARIRRVCGGSDPRVDRHCVRIKPPPVGQLVNTKESAYGYIRSQDSTGTD